MIMNHVGWSSCSTLHDLTYNGGKIFLGTLFSLNISFQQVKPFKSFKATLQLKKWMPLSTPQMNISNTEVALPGRSRKKVDLASKRNQMIGFDSAAASPTRIPPGLRVGSCLRNT